MRARALAAPSPWAPAEADPSASTSALGTPKSNRRAKDTDTALNGHDDSSSPMPNGLDRVTPTRHTRASSPPAEESAWKAAGPSAPTPVPATARAPTAAMATQAPGGVKRAWAARNARSDAPGPLLPRAAASASQAATQASTRRARPASRSQPSRSSRNRRASSRSGDRSGM